MDLLRFFVGIIILLFSFMGYSIRIKKVYGIDPYFIPFILCCGYALMIYVASLLGIMRIMTYICIVFGIVIFIVHLKDYKEYIKLLSAYIFYFGGLVILFLILRNRSFTLYDEFSHWGLITKVLLIKNAINDANDVVVRFTSYPQAAADFIYGINSIIGNKEGLIYFSQSIFIYSGLYTFLKTIKKNITYKIIFLLICYFSFTYIYQINALLVDLLLASTTFASMVFIYNYQKRLKQYIYILILMLGTLVLIKNSGIFLSIIPLALISLYLKKEDRSYLFFLIVGLLCIRFSWSLHVRLSFEKAGKHSMQIEYLAIQGLKKSGKDILIVTKKMFFKILKDVFMWIYIGLIILFRKLDKNKILYKKILNYSFICYFFYQFGIFMMYIFSMPTIEAIKLAGYDRYIKTIHLVLLIMSIYLICNHSKKIRYYKYIIITALFLSITFCTFPLSYQPNPLKNQIEAYKKGHIIRDRDKILIILKNNAPKMYNHYLCYYEFPYNPVEIVKAKNVTNKLIKEYKHVIDNRSIQE